MKHSIRVVLEKRRGAEPPVVAGEFMWRHPDLPSKMLFTAMVEELYDWIELPYFPERAAAEVELHDRIVRVEAEEPVAPPEEVGRELWGAMDKATSGP